MKKLPYMDVYLVKGKELRVREAEGELKKKKINNLLLLNQRLKIKLARYEGEIK